MCVMDQKVESSVANPYPNPLPAYRERGNREKEELGKTVSPLWELLSLAGPTVLQMMSYTLMQFIDTYLVSRLGYVEAAAVAMSGLFTFSVMCFGIGVLQLVNTLVSQ